MSLAGLILPKRVGNNAKRNASNLLSILCFFFGFLAFAVIFFNLYGFDLKENDRNFNEFLNEDNSLNGSIINGSFFLF